MTFAEVATPKTRSKGSRAQLLTRRGLIVFFAIYFAMGLVVFFDTGVVPVGLVIVVGSAIAGVAIRKWFS